MFYKFNLITIIIIIIMLFLLIIDLTIGLKSTDFCVLKQQEYKGFYDEKLNYQIKNESINCHGSFSYNCGANICSINEIQCTKYNKYKNVTLGKYKSYKKLNKEKKFNSFNKHIRDCTHKTYKFESNDFCLNGKNCKEVQHNRYRIYYEIDCKCPAEKSFKCGKYCTTGSDACNYYNNTNNSSEYFDNINGCGNHEMITFKTKFIIW
jgi:hypothetical protein